MSILRRTTTATQAWQGRDPLADPPAIVYTLRTRVWDAGPPPYKDVAMSGLPPSPPRDTLQEPLAGSVERVTFHREETGFCVLRVQVRGHRALVTVVGTAPTITPGEYIDAHGWWITDRTHGLQCTTTQLRVVLPTTLAGIEKYLGSGMVKGIGPHFARKLVQAFGAEVFD